MTRHQKRALRAVSMGTEHFGSHGTSRVTRKRDVLALAAMGLVEDVGFVAECDGDGFVLQPERYRRGWRITAAGQKVLETQP